MSDRINLMVSGTGWSGSGAVVDLFQEYSCTELIPREFDDFRRPGTVGDIIDSSDPIKLKHVTNASWRLMPARRRRRQSLPFIFPFLSSDKLQRLKDDKTELRALKHLIKQLNGTSVREERLKAANNWLNSIADYYGKNRNYTIIDQPIITALHENIWPEVFKPFKIIFIYREPKDQLANITKYANWYFEHTCQEYGNTTIEPVEFMCQKLYERLQEIDEIESRTGKDQVLSLPFEYVVEHYEQAKQKIEQFTGLADKDHAEPLKYFDPKISSENINIHEEYLTAPSPETLPRLEELYRERAQKYLSF